MTARAAGKPAKAAAGKGKPRKSAGKRTSPVRAFKPKAARTKAQPRRQATRPACPICNSRDVEVLRPANERRAQRKLAAGVVLPILVAQPRGLVCHACGYREESTA